MVQCRQLDTHLRKQGLKYIQEKSNRWRITVNSIVVLAFLSIMPPVFWCHIHCDSF